MNKKITRSYKLRIYPNFQKSEDIRYSANRYSLFLQNFTNKLYFNSHIRHFSTKGMGSLANKAQHQAKGIIKAERESLKERENKKTSCPEIKFEIVPGNISKNKNTSFDYWVTVISQWKNIVRIPAKSHSKLNGKLRNGWELSDYCEVYKNKKDEKWYVRVFVTKEVNFPEIKENFLGADVGINHASTRSDNYLGPNLSKIIKEEKEKQKSRQKNKHKKKEFKTKVKQLLDKEVNRFLGRSEKLGANAVVENPKALSNLCSGKLQGWARSYFANRLTYRAEENGVNVIYVNPSYTSITCSKCGKIDKESRVNQSKFICSSCGSEFNADINAAKNIARKGQERVKYLLDKTPVRLTLKVE